MHMIRTQPEGLSRNERLILSLIRRHGSTPRTALAQSAGVSAQAMTKLIRKLINIGLLQEQDAIRGKVGQPSTPLSLNPDGAYFIGLKLGRKLIEIALMDFAGQIKLHRQEVLSDIQPSRIINFARHGITTFLSGLSAKDSAKVAGLGIAAPFRLWDWGDGMDDWRGFDLRREIAQHVPFPVFLENDATTACGAELIFGRKDLPADFLHIYIAHFPGGGIVLDGNLRFGPRRNAAALGSLPLADGGQLVDCAAIAELERRLGYPLPPDDSGWPPSGQIIEEWAAEAGKALAFTTLSAVAIADLPVVMIDGAIPAPIRARLVEATRRAIDDYPTEGIDLPEIIEGTLGRTARVLGAAALPLSHFFQFHGQLH